MIYVGRKLPVNEVQGTKPSFNVALRPRRAAQDVRNLFHAAPELCTKGRRRECLTQLGCAASLPPYSRWRGCCMVPLSSRSFEAFGFG